MVSREGRGFINRGGELVPDRDTGSRIKKKSKERPRGRKMGQVVVKPVSPGVPEGKVNEEFLREKLF